jgi:hypothetical protein
MADTTSETKKERRIRKKNERLANNRYFCWYQLNLNMNEDSYPWILNHIDCFVGQSRGNESVKEVSLYPYYSIDYQDDDAWDKVGQAIGKLEALGKLHVRTPNYLADDEDDDKVVSIPLPKWETLARILSHVRQKVRVALELTAETCPPNAQSAIYSYCPHAFDVSTCRLQDSRSFARAIHGHPTITSFEGGDTVPYEASDALYSALASLPALESIRLSNNGPQTGLEDLANPESLTQLLRVRSLRSVCFYRFYFTHALCRSTANAFMEGTAVTELEFKECSFPDGECATILANGFSRNSSVSCVKVTSPFDEVLSNAFAAALTSNSTLQVLSFQVLEPYVNFGARIDWSPIFSALGNNIGLKVLSLDTFGSMDEPLCTAIQNGLGTNATLEHLKLRQVGMQKDEFALWCRALSFLCTNKALKSLVVNVMEYYGTTSFVSAFCRQTAAMLEENASLESLSIESLSTSKFEAEEYIALITALQNNKTLKTLKFYGHGRLQLTADEGKQMAAVLKKNYGLEVLPNIDLKDHAREIGTILRLNGAGRRYLIEDGSSVSKGVEVLSRVNNDINCVFSHLSENPRLCDRSVVEMVTAGESSGRSSHSTISSVGGKREQTSAKTGRESRRRLA